ncbi:hypothetical protein A2U01_0071514, partial [Trifolium medium]|nr:hypothetical protein [Trifolium medium]
QERCARAWGAREEKNMRKLEDRRTKVRELDSIIVSDPEEGRMSISPFPNSSHSISFGVG